MPSISSFYGLIVYMFNTNEHEPPHFHVKYQGEFSVFNLDGDFQKGNLPAAKQHLVKAWAILHKEELLSNWDLCMNHEALYHIDPLR